jgi:phage minor structural protein|nr:MAG TPA: tail protein [Caudoviricetes sp.]
MIKLFGTTDTDFSSNGDAVIQPFKAKVHKEDNGKFYLNVEADISYVDLLTANRIIVADTPQGAQAFRIKNPEKTKSKITIKAQHISYDAQNFVIADSYVVDKNCNDAMDHLNSATDNPSPFQTMSDIAAVNSYRCVRTSLYDAFSTVLERWGGHFVRDNYRFGIMSTIGRDNGVTVRYKKNLKEMTCTANWDNVVTKLMPVGKDGLLLDEVYLYGKTQYDIPFTKVVSFNQNVDQDLYKDAEGHLDEAAYNNALIEDLREQGQAYVDENCVPKVNYTLKANLEKLTDIGDTIEVIDEPMDVDITTHVISYDYDCILKKYTELEFGNFQQKVSDLMGTVSSTIQQSVEKNNSALQVVFSDAIQHAQETILGMLGNSYVVYEGDKILVVDALPKEEAHHVIMINSGGIGFSSTGINGDFESAWTIDNVLNMQHINVINLVADMIKGGTLKLGSNLNQNGQIEVYDEANNLIAKLDKNGLIMYGLDGSYLVVNNYVGFAGYDRTGAKTFWVSGDEFHQKKSVIEEEITLCNKARFIPITVKDGDTVTNDGIGIVVV